MTGPPEQVRTSRREMVTAGHIFHLSDDGVWLTATVPAGYLALKRTNP